MVHSVTASGRIWGIPWSRTSVVVKQLGVWGVITSSQKICLLTPKRSGVKLAIERSSGPKRMMTWCCTLLRWSSNFSLASRISLTRISMARSALLRCRLMSLHVVWSTPSATARTRTELRRCFSADDKFRSVKSAHSSTDVDLHSAPSSRCILSLFADRLIC